METHQNDIDFNGLPKFEANGYGSIVDQLDSKYFNDPIHGHIQLHPLLVKVIDTPQFQRLRNIKQLGANYFVYPGASHNRFEHCIGTCHLAGTLARHLQSLHPNLLDKRDILCVELAGLCHDLGHGPYSHTFDSKFIPKLNPSSAWKHEDGSCLMLDYLIEENNLKGEFRKYGLILPQDVIFIKEMINGPMGDLDAEWKYIGRNHQKSFLYEIISNERNKVDVDKWDYFARDCHHLGIKNSFDHKRFMQFLKVLTVEGEYPQICARDKECLSLYEMFHTRSVLHRRAYKHRVSTAIETMICDAMVLANDFIKIEGKNGRFLKISETVTDMVAFTKLTDIIFYQILYSTDDCDKMKEARRILNRILRRDLYKYVGQCRPPKNCSISRSQKDCKKIQEELAVLVPGLERDDVVINIVKFDYGMNDRNPCDQFRFYSKHNPNIPYQIRKEDISHMLPDTFEDYEILAYSKTAEKVELVKRGFALWCSNRKFSPSGLEQVQSSLTPLKPIKKRHSTSDDTHSKCLKFTN